jgi:multidrug efflux system outer membrane protein
MQRHSRVRYLLVLLSLATASCSTTWPEYERPPLDLPAAPAEPGKPLSIDRQWWKTFEDPALNTLVEEALLHNWDLAKAAANVAEARAAVASAKSLLSPRVDGVINASSSQRQLTLGSKEFDDVVSTGAVGAAVNWEIDLWDRIRQLNDAALARFAASEHARNATTLSISTLVAETWFQLRVLDAKLLVTRAAAANSKSVTDLEFRRWKAQVGTELAYIQSLAEYKATDARVPVYEEAVSQTELALKLLVGRSPRALGEPVPRPSLQRRPGEDLPQGSMPTVPKTPREVDSILLLRRPDVASAELLLVAAHADVNSARAEFYPRLTLSLVAGFVASTSGAISGMPLFWEAGAGLIGPIFDGGLVQSKVDSAEARRQKALAHYQYTVSLAFRDAYQALVQLDASDRQFKSIQEELTVRKRSIVLAEKSYDAGRTSKFEVLSETVKALNSALLLADARFNQLAARSQYYKALGGGF